MTVRRSARRAASLLVLLTALTAACGKKGPPLPPLVLLPSPPQDVNAVRRGGEVQLTFKVPRSNTDRSEPADLTEVDVYALTTAGSVGQADILRRGSRVGSLIVSKPKDPDEPEPATAPEGPKGLEQGDPASFSETVLTTADPDARRNYVIVGVNHRGRRGDFSQRVTVPLMAPPPAPPQPTATYDEKGIRLTWTAVPDGDAGAYSYSVYKPNADTALTTSPVTDALFIDEAITWDEERCYAVRAGVTIDGVRVEGPVSPETCVTPKDTFPPAPPEGLVSVASEGAISLIWSPNHEADLAGYLVMRAIAPATTLEPVFTKVISETNFKDTVQSGAAVTYAVVAVDKAGNRSQPSAVTTETVR